MEVLVLSNNKIDLLGKIWAMKSTNWVSGNSGMGVETKQDRIATHTWMGA